MRRITLLLSGCALAAATALAQEPAPDADRPAAEALNPLSALDKQSLTGFRDAPLFTASRRRPEPPEEVAAAPEPEPQPEPEPAPPPDAPAPELRLAGIAEGPDGAVAVVENAESGKTERLRLGDQIGGWLVTTIDPVALRLTLNEREEEYRLFDRSKEPASPTDELDEAPPVTPDAARTPRNPPEAADE
jgi:hypothetical protein